VNVLASQTYESILRKPFSVFRSDVSTGQMALLYQVHGATTFGMAAKRPGDLLDIVGPLGGRVFTADFAQTKRHILVGGGYGIPPLVFFASKLAALGRLDQIVAIVGARSRGFLLCLDDYAALGIEARCSTDDGSYGTPGKVTDILAPLLAPGDAVYSCGPTAMMRAVGELCVSKGIPCQLSLEVPMPCGIGVCMGCVIDLANGKRIRTCVDGPVVQASEVVWPS
jgi:dihydroorotate dehydrogenase electron transfer subunit